MKLAGYDRVDTTCHKTNMIRFMDTYGAHPESLAAIFNDLRSTEIPEAHMPNPDVTHFFMSLNWLKSYDTYYSMVARWKLDEKTIRKWVMIYIPKIQALKRKKIVWRYRQTKGLAMKQSLNDV